jgi:hypothetical protein
MESFMNLQCAVVLSVLSTSCVRAYPGQPAPPACEAAGDSAAATAAAAESKYARFIVPSGFERDIAGFASDSITAAIEHWSFRGGLEAGFRLQRRASRIDITPRVAANDIVECHPPGRSDLRIFTYRSGEAMVGGVRTVPYVVAAELTLPSGPGWLYFSGFAVSEDLRQLLMTAALSLKPI